MYPLSRYVAAGGLMSYGANLRDAFLQTGNYVGRILKGAKPSVIRHAHNEQFERQERDILQDAERRKKEHRHLHEMFSPTKRDFDRYLSDPKFAMACEINDKELNDKLTAIDAETNKKLAEVQKLKDGRIDEARCFGQWIDKVERINDQLEEAALQCN